MRRVDPTALDAIRARVDIVAVIGRDVALRRRGGSFVGRCPFHEERTPSFSVVAHRGYRCFGCGAHGDAIRYIEQSRGLSFIDAVRELGHEVGIEVPEPSPGRARTTPRATSGLPDETLPKGDAVELRAELLELWTRCLPIALPPNATEGQHLAWCALWESGIDPSLVARLDLARVLPDAGALPEVVPSWWRRGWWLVLPTVDHLGGFAGVRARFVARRWRSGKRAPPFAGKEASCSGAASAGRTYACPMAVAVLGSDRAIIDDGATLEWSGRVLLVEGGRGFLSSRCAPWAAPTLGADGVWRTDAVLGIWSGSWSATIADRVPSGSSVLVATDHDRAGDGYADAVVTTLEERCSVARWFAYEVAR